MPSSINMLDMARRNKDSGPRLGIDIGRVIIGPGDPADGGDTAFLRGSDEHAMKTPEMPGAVEAMASLIAAIDPARVWLVSKCGPRIEARSRRWLRRHRIFERTGLRPDQLRFCLKRHQKADHCRDLGINLFIDDRLDVLRHLRPLMSDLFWFGGDPVKQPPWARAVVDWPAAASAIHARLASGSRYDEGTASVSQTPLSAR
jgi:hypothetical protein